uniref:Gamma-interferon inducible lysosomal thiol reductase n=1 Tax=Caenorhabditis tropicalis TaxID=1561998 RepID=A0A1I7U1C7_9PELO
MTKIHLFLLVATLFVSRAFAGDLVEVFGIARCPDTSKFVKNQLVPFYEQFNANFSTDFKLDFHSVPTGGSEVNGRYVNKCLHGAVECALNKLQMCARKHIENDWMAVAGCVQGLKAYSEGVKCLPDTQEGQKVKQCAESEEGEYLLNDENSYRYNVAPGSSWLPWIQVNGVRNRDAEFHLKKVVCGLESMKDNGICK